MPKAALTIPLLILFSTPALAAELTAYDRTPPSDICDRTHGDRPLTVRPCYIPEPGPFDDKAGPFAPAHGNPNFEITVTLAAETTVEAEYDQVAFLSTEHGPFPMYQTAIGVDGTVCQGIQSVQNLDSPGSVGFTLISKCILDLPAGTHTFTALEHARDGASAFNGPGNQLLMVKY